MVLDPIPQPLPVHFFGSRPQPPTSPRDVPISMFKLSHLCIIMYTYTSVYIYPYADIFVFICIMRCLPISIYSTHFTLLFTFTQLILRFFSLSIYSTRFTILSTDSFCDSIHFTLDFMIFSFTCASVSEMLRNTHDANVNLLNLRTSKLYLLQNLYSFLCLYSTPFRRRASVGNDEQRA